MKGCSQCELRLDPSGFQKGPPLRPACQVTKRWLSDFNLGQGSTGASADRIGKFDARNQAGAFQGNGSLPTVAQPLARQGLTSSE